MKQRKIPAKACRFAVELQVGSNGENAKTAPVKLLARSGQVVDSPYIGPVVHDFAGMTLSKQRIPLDYCHNDNEVIGYANQFDTSSGDLIASGALVPYGKKKDDKASEVLYKHQQGVPYEASIFFDGPLGIDEYGDGEMAQVNGQQIPGPVTVFRKWTLRGIAICPYGVDANTQASFTQKDRDLDIEVLKMALRKWEPTPFADLPVTDDDWNPDDDSKSEIEDEILGDDDWDAMKQGHLAFAPGSDGNPPKEKGDYKLPIARRKDGKLTVYRAILANALAVINGARGGVDLPEAVKKTAFDHGLQYYKKMGIAEDQCPKLGEKTMDTSAEVEKTVEAKPTEATQMAVEVKDVEGTPAEVAPVETQTMAVRKSGEDFLQAFGDKGGVWFAQGKAFDECQMLFIGEMKTERDQLAAKVKELSGQLTALRGEAKPVSFSAEAETESGLSPTAARNLGGSGLAKFAANIKFKKN